MNILPQNVLYALRQLRRSPGTSRLACLQPLQPGNPRRPLFQQLFTESCLLVIIGLVHDFKFRSADEETIPMAWYSFPQADAIQDLDAERPRSSPCRRFAWSEVADVDS